jgi:hypothetical protein
MEDYRDCQLPISIDTDVQLRKEDVFTSVGKVPDKIALYNKHNDDYLSTVSKQSANNLRTYGQFCKMLSDALINADTGINPETCKVTDQLWQNGAKFSRVVEIPQYNFLFEGDKFVLILWAWTAYNLYWAEQFIFGPLCIKCHNGMFDSMWQIKGLSKKNWNNKSTLLDNDIKNAVVAFEEFPEQLEVMSKTKVSADKVKHLFENTLARIESELKPRVSEYRMRELSQHWDTYKSRLGDNLYAAYQTATHWASHPEGRGIAMNKTRNRSGQVAKMLNSNSWSNLIH